MTWHYECHQEHCFSPETLWNAFLVVMLLLVFLVAARLYQMFLFKRKRRNKRKNQGPPDDFPARHSPKNGPESDSPASIQADEEVENHT